MADRFQPRKLVLIGTLGMMSLSLIMGFTEQYWQVLSIQILWGFFSSFILIPAMSMFINWLPQQRRATATVLPMLGIGIGVLVVNLVFPVIVNRFESWRIPFIVAGIAGIILALALLLFGKDPGHRYTSSRFQINLIWDIFRHKQVRICCGLQFIRFGIVQGIVYWLPSLLIDEKAFPLQLAGLVIASQSIFGAPSNIFGAYISDKYNKPNLIIGISLAILGITTG
jgi:MFS family permease